MVFASGVEPKQLYFGGKNREKIVCGIAHCPAHVAMQCPD